MPERDDIFRLVVMPWPFALCMVGLTLMQATSQQMLALSAVALAGGSPLHASDALTVARHDEPADGE